MSDSSKIQWTDASWNFLHGCTKISHGCLNCYIPTTPPFRMSGRRFDRPGIGGQTGVVTFPEKLSLPLSWRKPRRIFVNSLSDVFHEDVPDELIARAFVTMARTPQHTYQLLTKRHGRMRSLIGGALDGGQSLREALTDEADAQALYGAPWPLPNVHVGVSAENQKWADIRIPALLETAAAVRWVSAEPLLGPIDLKLTEEAGECTCGGYCAPYYQHERGCGLLQGLGYGLDWVVCGGESGPGARPCDPEWIRSILKQCESAGVPAFNKQLGSVWASEWLLPVHRDPKAGNPEYWPEDLRVREYPPPAEVTR